MATNRLQDQPTPAPTRKIKGAALWGAAGVLAITGLSTIGVTIPGCDAGGLPIGEAATMLVTVGAGYLVRDRA